MRSDDCLGLMWTELLLGNIGAAQHVDDPCTHIVAHGVLNASGHLCQLLVMSSSGYSSSLEVKAGSSEVRRFAGIGFSSCAAPTFSRIQGILNGGTN